MARPGSGNGFAGLVVGRIRGHSLEGLGHGQGSVRLQGVGVVAAALCPHVLHAPQNRMLGLFGYDVESRTRTVVAAIVASPFFAQYLATEAVLVFVPAEAVVVFCIRAVLGDLVESVGGGAEPDDGSGPIQIVHEVLHLVFRPVLEASENHHDIRLRQLLDARHVIGPWLYFAFGVDPEDNGALEAMVLGQDTGKGRQSLFGAVFVVARYEYEVFTFAETLCAFVDERGGGKATYAGGN